MTTNLDTLPRRVTEDDPISDFCQLVFLSLARSDQRRWGEAYVRGLICVPGRKSIRRISDQIVGHRADQCLQQFVNQSPWAWEPVRFRLAQKVSSTIRARAWVVEEVAFPKNGENSVAVAKQYVPSAGRTMNCQLALATCLTSEDGSFPVNWRLILPQGWDGDSDRRSRAHLPEMERCRSRWACLLGSVDEMVASWDMTPPPILADARHDPRVEPLLRGLEERGLRYAVRVCGETPALPTTALSGRLIRVAELARMATRSRVTLTMPGGRHGQLVRSQVVVVPIPGAGDHPAVLPGRPGSRTRRVVAEWPIGRNKPVSLWLTNLNTAQLPELVGLLRLPERTRGDLARCNDESGLQHFEGRSFRGWHHHVTLASVAHGYRLLRERHAALAADYRLRPYALTGRA